MTDENLNAEETREAAPQEADQAIDDQPIGLDAVESGENPEDTKEPAQEKHQSGFQKRINKLVFEKNDERRKREALEQRLSELESKISGKQESKEPQLADFDFDYDAFANAKADYLAEQKVNEALAKRQKEEEERKNKERIESFGTQQRQYGESNPEYIELLSEFSQAVTSQTVADFLTSSEVGAQLHHELLKDISELERIQKLSPVQIGRELAKLEFKIQKPKPKEKAAPKPRVEPVKPLNSGQAPTAKVKGAAKNFTMPFG